MSRRHLFFDLEDVEASFYVTQRVMEATKHPSNPLLALGDLGEASIGPRMDFFR